MEQLETLYSKINHKKTKEYFREVLISYQNESYRSAIVMLYSIVIADILYKLSEMEAVYGDKNAKNILEDMRKKQKDANNKSQWEKRLIDDVKNKTKLLDLQLYENIMHLKQQRNFSAHPIIDNRDYLLTPTREDTIAQMRNMLIGLFTKPPIFTTNIVTHFVVDLSEKKDYLINDSDLKRYVVKNYTQFFDKELKEKIFNRLWKFTFKLNDDDANENRDINNRTLNILFDEYKNVFLPLLNEQYYHNNIDMGNNLAFNKCIQFIVKKNIYEQLNEDFKQQLRVVIEKDGNLKFISYFLSDNMEVYLSKIKDDVQNSEITASLITRESTETLYNICDFQGCKTKFLDLAIFIFSQSDSFDRANNNFNSYIEPFISEFNKEQLELLMKHFDENGQIRGRNRGKYDFNLIYNEFKNKNINIDKSKYKNLEIFL